MLVALLRFHAPGDPDGPPGARRPLSAADLVGQAVGFVGAEVLSDAKAPQFIYLATRWTDRRAFQRWHTEKAKRLPGAPSPLSAPDQPTLDRSFRLVLFVDRLAHPRGSVETDTLPFHLPELVGRFLAESRSAHFIAASETGVVLACNAAVTTTLALPASKVLGQKLWRFLADADARRVQQWSGRRAPPDERFHLDLLPAHGAPTTLECRLVARAGGVVILGEPVQEEEVRRQGELLELDRRLALLARENVRKGKALRRLHARLRTTLEAMKEAHALWEATALFEATLRDLERSIRRLERTDQTVASR